MSDHNETRDGHQPVPTWAPICEVCGRAIYLDDSETWQHEAAASRVADMAEEIERGEWGDLWRDLNVHGAIRYRLATVRDEPPTATLRNHNETRDNMNTSTDRDNQSCTHVTTTEDGEARCAIPVSDHPAGSPHQPPGEVGS